MGEGSLKVKFRQNVAAIELLRALEAENRAATRDEQAVLVKYTGWGGMPQAFGYGAEPAWQQEREDLHNLLTPEEFASARATTLNAHYTSPVVILAMYQTLDRLGFKGGRILEPACGLGHFIGLMPEAMREQSTVTGIEIDSVTARLAGQLYPGAQVRHEPFEQAKLPDGAFDVAISNVPFGDYRPFHPRFKAYKFPIHDYFFAASLERVRPGGLILFITSKGTLDKKSTILRQYVADRANLVGAIRLPNDAFKRNANTEVTTDIVILRKLGPGESPSGPTWREVVTHRNNRGEEMLLNEYFAAHPEQMLGTMQLTGRLYGRGHEPTLVGDGRDLGHALAAACERLPSSIYQARDDLPTIVPHQKSPQAVGDLKPFAFTVLDDGRLARREGEELVPVTGLAESVTRRIERLIQVRDAVRDCLRTQMDGSPEDAVTASRDRLNREYDRFTARFGPISAPGNTRAFSGDPDLPLLLSLEHYSEETKTATKEAIFRDRTIHHQNRAVTAETSREALLISLNETGRIDFERMQGLTGQSQNELVEDLKGAIYQNPQTKGWETDDQYLAGNVRAKLATAREAARIDHRYRDNETALAAVQPPDLNSSEIDARLGSVWIPKEDVEAFVRDLLHLPESSTAVSVRHAPIAGIWTVQADYLVKSSVANIKEFGTDRASALDLIEDALNLRTATIHDFDPVTEARVLNPAATEAAREKQGQIKESFQEWLWRDESRRERLTRKYNEEFNHLRPRVYSGAHLTLPGASQTVTLRAHQKAAVWRILQSPNTLLAHTVGAGKTYTMVAAAMEAKRLGMARKPLFVVPNHMLGQFSTELLNLYPNANILVAGRDDFESFRRRQLMSRIATGSWDAVIVTHSGFERIPISQRAQETFLEEQLDELTKAILEQKADTGNRLVKDLERAKKRLETKLKSLAADGKKDDAITFEELGVDRLFVDEAHYFKNLFYVTKMTRVAGLPQTASERAFDMYLKVRHIQHVSGGGGVVFATGTPVANSMAELYTMQRYLQPEALKGQNLAHFDSWAATFGETVTAMELAPDGAGYRLNTRFARFVNVPELMVQFRQVADIQTAEMLQLPTPKLTAGKAAIVQAPATPELKAFVAGLAQRADRLKTTRVDPAIDNMLKITGEGRKAALDLRLVQPSASDHPESKLALAAREIVRVWRDTAADRSTQLVFCDLSTPKPEGGGFSAYTDLKHKLVREGIPPGEIAFIQDYETDSEKLALFKQVRRGDVRILLGSTAKMGTGTNVQERLIALHHLDAPWRPADIEQRDGRILRQGNRHPEVTIQRYVAQGSFDAYMWQTLETKARFISQVMAGDTGIRRIEDIDAPALSYAEIKAIASGNPLVIEKAQVDAEVMRLCRLQSQHQQAQRQSRYEIRGLEEEAPRLEKRISALEADIRHRHDTRGEAFRIVIEGRVMTDRAEAGEAILRAAEDLRSTQRAVKIGELGGLQLELPPDAPGELTLRGHLRYSARISGNPLGTISSLEHALRSMEEQLAGTRSQLSFARQRAFEIRSLLDQPFPHESKLRELTQRQTEIVRALDITRGDHAPCVASESPVTTEKIMVSASAPGAARLKVA